jgi:hypothetical protein
VVRELLDAEELEASVRATRWHPVAGEWKDADAPLPDTPEAIEAERREHAAQDREDLHAPEFVQIASYKPKFLRDLGL